MYLKNHLFDLIKSMDQAEKRYFKIYTGRYTRREKSSYLKLFEVIAKLKKYDEGKLRLLLKGENFVTRLAVEKNTLHKLVLKSLENYHSEKTEEAQARHLLIRVEVLYGKSLYNQCERLLSKAEKIANVCEARFLLLDIYKWQKILWNIKDGNSRIDLIVEKEKRVICEIENEHLYSKLYTSMRSLLNIHGYNPRDEDVLKELDQIMAEPLMQSEDRAISNAAKQMFHTIHASFALVYDKSEDAYKHYSKQIELIELILRPVQIQQEQYMAAKYNCLICLMHMDKEKMLRELASFREIPRKRSIPLNLRINQFIMSSYELELSFLINHFMFERAKKFLAGIRMTLQRGQYILGADRYAHVCYSAAFVYFVEMEYKMSYKWIVEIIDNPAKMEVRNYHNAAARILSMFIHYEMKKKDLLSYLERSVNRFLHKKEILYETERAILKFFRKTLANEIRGDLLKDEFEKFRTELIELFKNPNEAQFLKYFDIISWVESKIENKSFIEVIAKNFKRTSSDL